MITKEEFIIQIINFGTETNPVTARTLFNKFHQPAEKIEDYQRVCAKYAREIIQSQFEMKDLVQRKKIILSSNGGYYVATTRTEALRGLHYYESKILPMLTFRHRMKKTIDDTFPEKEQTDLFY